ncbi:MAG: MiaB/RimO family radical SAM methylthiotransferase, partial [Bacteroidales bacterium]
GVNSINEILEKLCHGEKVKLFNDRIITGPGHYAYLKISEGCDRTCAFCSIPGIRGKYVSKSVEEIINEAGNLAEKGIKELILIAQVLNYYGADLYGRRMLTHLIYKILERNYFEWIRLQYLYPEGIFESLLDIIRTSKQVCKYIDIPIQHISSRMLKLMKRSYSRYRVEKLLNTIRDKIPEAAIRTAIIVGHPGESKKDFEELKDFISGFQFDRLGVFKYSHEEGTYSYKNYSDSIPQKEKEARASELMEIQQDISLKLNTLKINKVFKTIIDRREGGYYTGRTEFDSPEVDNEVLIENRFNLKPGLFYNIRIIDAREFDLFGVPEF